MNTLSADAMFIIICAHAVSKFLGELYYTSSVTISETYIWKRIRTLGLSGLIKKIHDPEYYAQSTIRRRSLLMIGIDTVSIAGYLYLLHLPCKLWQIMCFLFFAPLIRMTVGVTSKDAIMSQELAINQNVADLWLNMAKDMVVGLLLYSLLIMLN